jgi:hypothetical protein
MRAHAHRPAHGRVLRRGFAERLMAFCRPAAPSAPHYVDHRFLPLLPLAAARE